MSRIGDRVRKDMGRWGWRTIKNGRIRWMGEDYEVDDRGATKTVEDVAKLPFAEQTRHHVKYDGRLEGERMLFYTYGTRAREQSAFVDAHVFLWGNEDWPGPHCVDGIFRFGEWRRVE